MTRPLSMDLRERLVSAVDGGLSRRDAASRFGVAPSTAITTPVLMGATAISVWARIQLRARSTSMVVFTRPISIRMVRPVPVLLGRWAARFWLVNG